MAAERILITGAGGFVGQALVRALAGTRPVIATDRTGLDFADLPSVTALPGEIDDPALVAALTAEPLAAIIHLATIPGGAAGQVIPFSIGGISSMMGIGGGTLSVPVMTLFNFPIHRAVGTAALFGLLISAPATVAFVITGWNVEDLPPGSLGYVNLIGFAIIVRSRVSMCEVPSVAIVPELTADYDERTAVMRYRFLFGWGGGLLILLLAYGVFFGGAKGLVDPDGYFPYALTGALLMTGAVMLSAAGQSRQSLKF